MELHRTDEGFALYKEKTQIGFCALTPAAKGAAITAFGIEPQWRLSLIHIFALAIIR